jgi:hypothetical protein
MILFKDGAAAKTIIGSYPKRKLLEQLELTPAA